MYDDRLDDPEFIRWAKAVKVEAGFCCDICSKRGVYLESHHLDSWDWCVEKHYDLSNGKCLCQKCHHHFHQQYNYGGNHKWQYEQFKKSFSIIKKLVQNRLVESGKISLSDLDAD